MENCSRRKVFLSRFFSSFYNGYEVSHLLSELHHLSSLKECATEIEFPKGCFFAFIQCARHRKKLPPKLFQSLVNKSLRSRRWKIYWISSWQPASSQSKVLSWIIWGWGKRTFNYFLQFATMKMSLFSFPFFPACTENYFRVLEKQESLQRVTRLWMNRIGYIKLGILQQWLIEWNFFEPRSLNFERKTFKKVFLSLFLLNPTNSNRKNLTKVQKIIQNHIFVTIARFCSFSIKKKPFCSLKNLSVFNFFFQVNLWQTYQIHPRKL